MNETNNQNAPLYIVFHFYLMVNWGKVRGWDKGETEYKARVPRACALQQEKPLQWEAPALQRRVAPAHQN